MVESDEITSEFTLYFMEEIAFVGLFWLLESAWRMNISKKFDPNSLFCTLTMVFGLKVNLTIFYGVSIKKSSPEEDNFTDCI